MKERTEEEMLAWAPLEIQLAREKYPLPVACRLDAAAWREKLIAQATKMGSVGVSVDGMGSAISAFPDIQAELIIAYAPTVLSTEILNKASEEEIGIAFSAIVSVSFPFLRQLSLMKAISLASLSRPEKSSNSSFSSTGSRQIN